jgi:hypothetical protein
MVCAVEPYDDRRVSATTTEAIRWRCALFGSRDAQLGDEG